MESRRGYHREGDWRPRLVASLARLPIPLAVERLEVAGTETRPLLRIACRIPAGTRAGRRVQSPRTRGFLVTGEALLPRAPEPGDRPSHRRWLVALARALGEALAARERVLGWWSGHGRPAARPVAVAATPLRRRPRPSPSSSRGDAPGSC